MDPPSVPSSVPGTALGRSAPSALGVPVVPFASAGAPQDPPPSGVSVGTLALCLAVVVILLTVICFVYWKRPRLLSPIIKPPASFFVLATFQTRHPGAMKEWLQHYAEQGAEHVVLVDTGTQEPTYTDAIQDFVNSGFVSVFRDTRGASAHREVLNYYFRQAVAGKTDWVLVCDLDEYVFGTKRVPLALELLEVPDDVGALYFRWVVFGSGGHTLRPASVLKGYTRRAAYPDPNPASGLARSRYLARADSVAEHGLDVFEVGLKPKGARRVVRFGESRTEGTLPTEPIRVHKYAGTAGEAVDPGAGAALRPSLHAHAKNDKEDKSLA